MYSIYQLTTSVCFSPSKCCYFFVRSCLIVVPINLIRNASHLFQIHQIIHHMLLVCGLDYSSPVKVSKFAQIASAYQTLNILFFTGEYFSSWLMHMSSSSPGGRTPGISGEILQIWIRFRPSTGVILSFYMLCFLYRWLFFFMTKYPRVCQDCSWHTVWHHNTVQHEHLEILFHKSPIFKGQYIFNPISNINNGLFSLRISRRWKTWFQNIIWKAGHNKYRY